MRIGELARRAGVPAATLRAWERRYGVVTPYRGDSGYRLYSASDERRVRKMVELMESGLAAAEAAHRVRAEAAPVAPGSSESMAPGASGPSDPSPRPEAARAELLDALERYDGEAAEHAIDRAIGSLSTEAFLSQLALPVLRDLGDRWARGAADISEEHFASSLLRGRLLGLARGWDTGSGPLALLACPPGERHDLGVICFGLALRARGWRIAFLGGDTPPEALRACVEKTSPALVVLFAMERDGFELMEEDLRAVGVNSDVRLAGAGADPDLCARIGARRLEGDPVEAAAAL